MNLSLSHRPWLRSRVMASAAAIVALLLAGCGGSGSSSSSSTSGSGVATMVIKWPEATRLIPLAANSITASLYSGSTKIKSTTVARPTTGNTSTVTFSGLPAGTLSVSAAAYPNSDGTGVAQASALTTMLVQNDKTTTISLTMASTITEVEMTPTTATIGINATQQVTANPINVDGDTVLVAADNVTWESSDETVATVSDTGLVTALATGTTTITYTESESAKVGTTTITVSTTPGGSVMDLVTTYLSSLSTAQQSASVVSATASNAAKWSDEVATPATDGTNSLRNGVAYSTLSTTQRTAFLNLAQAALGAVGYDRLQQILASGDYLNDTDTDYNSGYVYMGFVGTPSASSNWILQISGHNFAANVYYSGNTPLSTTPYFAGVEPASFTLDGTTYYPLTAQRTALKNLMEALSSSQRTAAKLSTSFSDVLLGPGMDARSNFPTGTTGRGIIGSSLTDTQQELLLTAIKAWTQDSILASTYNTLYEDELDSTYVAWSGTVNLTTAKDYMRIDGPHVWIEFCVADGTVVDEIQYKSVWRDRVSDYNSAYSF